MEELDRELEMLLADESFQAWLAGRSSADENRKWQDWLSSSPLHREIYREAVNIWHGAQFTPARLPDIESELERLKGRLSSSVPEQEKSQATVVSGRRQKRWPFSKTIFISASAAVLAFLLFVLLRPDGVQYSAAQDFNVITTLNAQKTKLKFPDNTTVILNANSTLKYPAVWSRKTKRQFLLKGEAFFDVTSRPQDPQNEFLVSTDAGLIQVLGTCFVVYDRGQGTRIVLEDGMVEVYARDLQGGNIIASSKVRLHSGEMLSFQKGAATLVPQSGSYISWWKDAFELDNTPFKEIVKFLEETYDIEIRVIDSQLLNRTLSGSIENHDLRVILEALASVLQVPVRWEGETVVFGESSV